MIRIGTTGWTHASLHGKGAFYPLGISPRDRLCHYGATFPIVEVASSFYGLSMKDEAFLWAERSPKEFLFHFQAPAMLTGFPVAPENLPGIIARELGRGHLKMCQTGAFPPEILEMAFDMFMAGLRPLREAGKLGAIVCRFPAWFEPVPASYAYLELVREKTVGVRSALEFQHVGWQKQPEMGKAMAFLKQRQMAYVAVDASRIRGFQGPGGLTAPFAYVRLCGRSSGQRFLYSQRELEPWASRVLRAESRVGDVFALFASRQGMDAVRNARLFGSMLQRKGAAVQGTPRQAAD